MLRVTRLLYNALLWQRRDAWSTRRQHITTKQQYAQITELRAYDTQFAAVFRECEDAALRRLDIAMSAFFRRLKGGGAPGYPRFKPAARWSQIEFPHGDRALIFDDRQRHVRVPGVGAVALRKGPEVPAFGRAFIVTKNGRRYAVFEAHRCIAKAPATGKVIGIDRGVRVLAALSDGTLIKNARSGSRRSRLMVRHARRLDDLTERDVFGHATNRRDRKRIAAVRRLGRAQERAANARRDWLHKVSRQIVDRFDVIALERLNLRNMTASGAGSIEAPGTNVRAKAGLNRAILDAGFGMLATLIREKAEYAARMVIGVDAKYSSQTCASCGHVAAASREGPCFSCVSCGFNADADVNAARVILLRAELRPTRAPGLARGELCNAT